MNGRFKLQDFANSVYLVWTYVFAQILPYDKTSDTLDTLYSICPLTKKLNYGKPRLVPSAHFDFKVKKINLRRSKYYNG